MIMTIKKKWNENEIGPTITQEQVQRPEKKVIVPYVGSRATLCFVWFGGQANVRLLLVVDQKKKAFACQINTTTI
jgi:hypothetical protein